MGKKNRLAVRTRVRHALALRLTNLIIVDLIAPGPTELLVFAFGVSQNKDLTKSG